MEWMIKKRFEVSASHQLNLPYESKCNGLHGHNWLIDICVNCNELENNMVIDFNVLKEKVFLCLDHKHLNDIIPDPTVENIAYWVAEQIGFRQEGKRYWCSKVVIQESEGNVCEFTC
ncbi:MAG TPA: 6-carboxytetrahydropterin synthase [Sunxiuqinia sp.]|nr:6-carboxytetrahydropterin synthase [Sunxiuqinia sp.]